MPQNGGEISCHFKKSVLNREKMLIDTHCHLNMMIKSDFDVLLSKNQLSAAQAIIDEAAAHEVTTIINVGTSLVESENCIALAKAFESVYATVGIHPNDATEKWADELKKMDELLQDKEANKIVGIGETGIDRHYPEYNLQRQVDAFRAQIEMALSHNVGLVIHSRDAYDETLRVLEEYARHEPRAVMHCFSYDQNFADQVISWGFKLGIGGTLTYPKNDELRSIVKAVKLSDMILETDAPFLPIQSMRGKKNAPQYIKSIAEYIAELRMQPFADVALETTHAAKTLFSLV